MKKNSGYITLLSVLIIGAIGSAIVVGILLDGIGASRTGFDLENSASARSIVNACVESALNQIHNSPYYTGSGNISFASGFCSYLITSEGGENRTITASSTAQSSIRKVSLTINTIFPKIQISSWQEVQ
jgi:hypothetical protein